MATLDSLQFEIERRVIFLKPTTTLPDLSPLGYNDDPNLIVNPSTEGERLLYYCPNNTRYVNYDASGNTIREWYKHSQPNGWLPLGGGNIYGTDSSTWQLNITKKGVILQSDGSSNLIIRDNDGSLGTLIIGNLVIDRLTGYLKAIDGSIVVDPSISSILKYSWIIEGDGITKDFVVPHNLNTINHMIMIYDEYDSVIYPEIIIGVNSDSIKFSSPISSGINYRVVIMGF
ncbi:MAG TPA: hypothetical protein P5513_05990 [Candidatus Diapherotrites archaeon]|nr:hypothetical protein [Candidatus Diapherotrites archaeon]